MSFKAEVKTRTDINWVSNALRFSSREQAEAYAKNLMQRWTAVTEWRITESTDEANATFPTD